jgi:SnoaL-like domain
MKKSILALGLLASALWLPVGHARSAAVPDAALVRLAAGVEAAEALRAVKRVQHSYSHYLDAGMWRDAAGLFARDGVAQFPEGEVRGHKALEQLFMQRAGRKSPGLHRGQLHAHLIMQPIITLGLDGRSARGTWHEMALLGRHGVSASWAGGVYENEYVLEQGVWKISRLRYFTQYSGPYDDYGHKAPPKWNIPYHFEAAHVGRNVPAATLDALSGAADARSDLGATDLQRRVSRLHDENAVRNLQHAYGYYLDRKMWDDAADLFAADGLFEVAGQRGRRGREQILKALEASFGPRPLRRGELFDHIMLGTVVTIEPDGVHASARTTQLGMLGLNGQYAKWELGVYENRFIKHDGKWQITALRYFPRMTADYDLGWANDPGAMPSRQPPMHFAHPVTGRVARATASAASTASLTQLQQQIDAAIAVDAVENLMSSYGYYIDESDWDGMADTYASIGSKEITGAGVYVGPERIRKILKLRGPLGGRTANFFTIHQLTQPLIHIAADGRSAQARLRLFQCGGSADGSSGSWIGGIYENTAFFENGEWKFGAQDLHHIFNASYRNGWARVGPNAGQLAGRPPSPRDARGGGITQGLGGARGGGGLATEFPPDRPIRARQYAFPEIVEPAFHYANPVSERAPPEWVK